MREIFTSGSVGEGAGLPVSLPGTADRAIQRQLKNAVTMRAIRLFSNSLLPRARRVKRNGIILNHKETELKKLVLVIVSTLLIMFASPLAFCGENTKNDQPPTENRQGDVDRDFAKMSKEMTPMFGNMVESMMQGKLKVFAQQETTVLLAKFVKNFYDDLVAEGFSKEEALQIVTGFGFPAIQ